MLLSFSDLREVLALFACLCIQRWHGSMIFVVLRILREAVSPKEVPETPSRKLALIWTAFLPLLQHETSFLSLYCFPTCVCLVHFNLSFHSKPQKWAFLSLARLWSPILTRLPPKNSQKYLFCAQNMKTCILFDLLMRAGSEYWPSSAV